MESWLRERLNLSSMAELMRYAMQHDLLGRDGETGAEGSAAGSGMLLV
jgi:hypothetical protein